jgi:hypothetical protein
MFGSSSRLDLGITVGPQKPGNIKTILSSSLPIFIDYRLTDGDITGSALWRLRAALKHHDRVREISFEVTSANFNTFFRVTGCHFPVLESLALCFSFRNEPKIPDVFLRGPDLSVLHLRRLRLTHVSLATVSEFLSSATALTDLYLVIDAGTALLACLQGMLCLRSLTLFLTCNTFDSPWQPSTPKDIVLLSKLTSFHYFGHSAFLDALVAGLSAPSLLDIDINFLGESPIVHLPRFIDEIEEHYHAVHLVFQNSSFRLLLLHSEYISHCKPPFQLDSFRIHSWTPSPLESITHMSGTLSTRLTTVEALCVTFDKTANNFLEDYVAWRRFYQQFPSVKTLRMEGANSYCFARTLLQDHEEPDSDPAFFPALEEIEIERDSWMIVRICSGTLCECV